MEQCSKYENMKRLSNECFAHKISNHPIKECWEMCHPNPEPSGNKEYFKIWPPFPKEK
jgi:mannose-6-phosphate isomerase class I